MTDNVRELPNGLRRALRTATLQTIDKNKAPEDERYCTHSAWMLDESSRRVNCRRCGREVDAFQVLLELQREEHALLFSRHLNRQEEAKLIETKKQLANAKAALRRSTKP
jgi:hypothetical protein